MMKELSEYNEIFHNDADSNECPICQDLPRPEVSLEEKIHEQQVRLLNAQYPELDPLMCSVLLKCPPELMEELRKDPAMWITPQASSHVILGNITVSDSVPVPELESH
jgi:hypothetical protein